ncbi:MAG: bifunctional hydroxymethylpyrimidine kinase/phosphomethylpyrimidine kinase [Acholeplasmatales bacterium]|nr:bifunctional hydroxymethylpyrimidine kinase/phosphomethylpyrimidine kinase [Acholeplasmatales bacterium]
MKVVLSIAGSDSSGGAGIQADIKTILANKCFAETAITALTAQNTLGVTSILNVTPKFLEDEIDAVFTDIRPDAVKIGMVSDKDLIKAIAKKLKEYKAERIVVDPVMVATSGARLLSDDAMDALINELIPLADIITPNIPEAEVLSGIKIKDSNAMEEAAKIISKLGSKSVLVKGGHSINDANDLLYTDGSLIWIKGERIDNPNTHGTGCTLSSAIASNLAKDKTVEESIRNAKAYLSDCLRANLNLGKGSGPLDHGCNIKEKYND